MTTTTTKGQLESLFRLVLVMTAVMGISQIANFTIQKNDENAQARNIVLSKQLLSE